jgi:DNA repair protein RecN (Recombination protein N)
VAELATIDPQFNLFVEARDGIKSQLEDLAAFLRRYAGGIEASPAHLQQVEERLALLERLKRKHGPTLADVIAKRDTYRREVEALDQGEDRIADLERALAHARTRYLESAGRLSASRRETGGRFSSALEALLAELAMERTRVHLKFEDEPLTEDAWTAQGVDRAEFYVSPNVGEELRPLARIVSGGELSRIMLAIKTLTATSRRGFSNIPERPPSRAAPGLIFDEVDAGIGGRVADVVGRKLRALGSAFQVLCITHLAQIAACADTHFQITKRVENDRTKTTVTRLDEKGRIDELGRMLGGAVVTDAIRASAREMLLGRHRVAKGESERRKRSGIGGQRPPT